MLNRYVSDLQVGDVFEPVTYVMAPFVIREYCHGVEERWARFHGDHNGDGDVQVAAPTLAHIEKQRLLKKNCPGGPGPHARIHFEYHAKHFQAIPAGTTLITSGEVTDRSMKNGREYLSISIEVRSAESDDLFTQYRDRAVLSYQQGATDVEK